MESKIQKVSENKAKLLENNLKILKKVYTNKSNIVKTKIIQTNSHKIKCTLISLFLGLYKWVWLTVYLKKKMAKFLYTRDLVYLTKLKFKDHFSS